MSWQGTSWAASVRVGNPVLKLLLLVLANFADENGECWYSQKRISIDSEIPERTLRRKLSELVEAGLIEVHEQRREDGSRLNNLVRLRMPAAKLAGCEESTTGQNSNRPKSGVTIGQKRGSQPANMVAAIKESNGSQDSVSLRAKSDDGWPTDFLDQFWNAFPKYRRQAKRLVGDKLTKLRKGGLWWETLMAGVQGYAASDPGEYAKAPLAWLNGEQWDREYTLARNGARDAASRNGSSKVGFSGLAARLRQEIRDEELFDRGCAPEDLRPVNGR